MSDLRSVTVTQYNILGSTGAHEICIRAAVREGGANQTIVPGTVMMVAGADGRACSPWDGDVETTPEQIAGVALEAATLTATAQPLNLLVSGTVNNSEIIVHGFTGLSAEQWNYVQQFGIVPQGFEYIVPN